MTTVCSTCGIGLDEIEADGRFVNCKKCHKFIPVGANSYTGKEATETKQKEKKPKKIAKGPLTVRCSVCGKNKAVRPDIYEERVKKFGSVEKLNKKYVCRDCKHKEKK